MRLLRLRLYPALTGSDQQQETPRESEWSICRVGRPGFGWFSRIFRQKVTPRAYWWYLNAWFLNGYWSSFKLRMSITWVRDSPLVVSSSRQIIIRSSRMRPDPGFEGRWEGTLRSITTPTLHLITLLQTAINLHWHFWHSSQTLQSCKETIANINKSWWQGGPFHRDLKCSTAWSKCYWAL